MPERPRRPAGGQAGPLKRLPSRDRNRNAALDNQRSLLDSSSIEAEAQDVLCCGTVALAASLAVAVGRRAALAILVTGGVLIDPEAIMGHALGRICGL